MQLVMTVQINLFSRLISAPVAGAVLIQFLTIAIAAKINSPSPVTTAPYRHTV